MCGCGCGNGRVPHPEVHRTTKTVHSVGQVGIVARVPLLHWRAWAARIHGTYHLTIHRYIIRHDSCKGDTGEIILTPGLREPRQWAVDRAAESCCDSYDSSNSSPQYGFICFILTSHRPDYLFGVLLSLSLARTVITPRGVSQRDRLPGWRT